MDDNKPTEPALSRRHFLQAAAALFSSPGGALQAAAAAAATAPAVAAATSGLGSTMTLAAARAMMANVRATFQLANAESLADILSSTLESVANGKIDLEAATRAFAQAAGEDHVRTRRLVRGLAALRGYMGNPGNPFGMRLQAENAKDWDDLRIIAQYIKDHPQNPKYASSEIQEWAEKILGARFEPQPSLGQGKLLIGMRTALTDLIEKSFEANGRQFTIRDAILMDIPGTAVRASDRIQSALQAAGFVESDTNRLEALFEQAYGSTIIHMPDGTLHHTYSREDVIPRSVQPPAWQLLADGDSDRQFAEGYRVLANDVLPQLIRMHCRSLPFAQQESIRKQFSKALADAPKRADEIEKEDAKKKAFQEQWDHFHEEGQKMDKASGREIEAEDMTKHRRMLRDQAYDIGTGKRDGFER